MRIRAIVVATLFALGLLASASASAQEVTVCANASLSVTIDGETTSQEAGDCITLPPA